jgi:Zn-dependent alcohol dehydrogenase
VKNKDLKVGDFVLLSINYCEECKFCKTGHPANCIHGTRLHLTGVRPDGSTGAKLKGNGESVRAHFFGQSSFLKTAYVQETCVVKFDGKPEEAGIFASMGCGYQTGAGTVMNILKPEADSSIVIFGLGTVGLTALMAAKYMKVRQIIAVDIQPLKLPIAQDLGATDVINGREVQDVVEKIKELTGGTGADYAVDCTGVPAVIENMLNCLSMFGTAAQVGVPPSGAKIAVDPLQFLLGSKKYVGCREGDSVPQVYCPQLVELQRKGDFPVDKIVKIYDYKDFDQALHDLHNGTTTKPVIQWS